MRFQTTVDDSWIAFLFQEVNLKLPIGAIYSVVKIFLFRRSFRCFLLKKNVTWNVSLSIHCNSRCSKMIGSMYTVTKIFPLKCSAKKALEESRSTSCKWNKYLPHLPLKSKFPLRRISLLERNVGCFLSDISGWPDMLFCRWNESFSRTGSGASPSTSFKMAQIISGMCILKRL